MKLPHIIITGEAGHGKDTIGAYLVEHHGYTRTAFADPLKNEISMAYAGAPAQVDLAFMNNRDTKKTPMARLALQHCSDQAFVEVALKVFAQEDQEIFDNIKRHLARGADLPAANLPMVGRTLQEAMRDTGFNREERLALPRSFRRIGQVWGTEYRRSDRDTYWVDQAEAFKNASATPVAICDGRFQNECEWGEAQGFRRIHVYRPGHSETLVKHASEQIPSPDERTAVICNDRTDDNFAGLYVQIRAALARFQQEALAAPVTRPRATV